MYAPFALRHALLRAALNGPSGDFCGKFPHKQSEQSSFCVGQQKSRQSVLDKRCTRRLLCRMPHCPPHSTARAATFVGSFRISKVIKAVFALDSKSPDKVCSTNDVRAVCSAACPTARRTQRPERRLLWEVSA